MLRNMLGALSAIVAFSSSAFAANTFELKFFDVDDTMKAFITNADYTSQLVLERGFGANYPAIDITPYVADGLNTIELKLYNGSAGYTYGYDFLIDSVSYQSGQCGTFNTFGCDNNSYAKGLVWSETITFNHGVVSGIPEPSTWLMMIIGFGLVGVAGIKRTKTLVL